MYAVREECSGLDLDIGCAFLQFPVWIPADRTVPRGVETPTVVTGKAITQACDGELRRMQTDYLDLFQIHWPDRCDAQQSTCPLLDRIQNHFDSVGTFQDSECINIMLKRNEALFPMMSKCRYYVSPQNYSHT